jgi:HD-like signal output (HDOD) protein
LRGALSDCCPHWQTEFISDASHALTWLAQHHCEILFLDAKRASGCALTFLDAVWQRHPQILRFVCAESPDQALTLKCAWNSHRLFTEPLGTESIRASVERALEAQGWLTNPSVQARVARLRVLPTIPSLYFKLLKLVASPDPDLDAVTGLIESDLAISTQLIRVVNSAYYSYGRRISGLKEATQILGLEVIKSLVLAIQAFAQMDGVKPVYFSVDKVWRHSLAVGKWAREIAQSESEDKEFQEHTYTASLLHDIGKIVFAANLNVDYNSAIRHAKERRISLIDAEAQILGATHAEIAAYLAALWNLPRPVVDAIGFHHTPENSRSETFSPMTAVYAANVLQNQQNPNHTRPLTDNPRTLEYLHRVGVADMIATWATRLGVSLALPSGERTLRPATRSPIRGILQLATFLAPLNCAHAFALHHRY